MSFYGLVYTLCAIEFIDILDIFDQHTKAILMTVATIVSIVIQLWRKSKGKTEQTKVEKVCDTIIDKLSPENKKDMEVTTDMYEVGMSPLVQDICNLYAQNKGLNYPPCTQQMINAVTEWLNNNAIKDVKSITSSNVGNNVTLTITYTHPNGTTVEDSISFTVPTVKGEDGKDGTNGVDGKDGTNGVDGKDGRGVTAFASGTPVQEDGYTVTPVTALFTDGTTNSSFNVSAKNGENGVDGANGEKGADGNGITNITAGTPIVSDDKTITPINIQTSNGTPYTFNVEAQNGADGDGGGASGKNGYIQALCEPIFNEETATFSYEITSTVGNMLMEVGDCILCVKDYNGDNAASLSGGTIFQITENLNVQLGVGSIFTQEQVDAEEIKEIGSIRGSDGQNGVDGIGLKTINVTIINNTIGLINLYYIGVNGYVNTSINANANSIINKLVNTPITIFKETGSSIINIKANSSRQAKLEVINDSEISGGLLTTTDKQLNLTNTVRVQITELRNPPLQLIITLS